MKDQVEKREKPYEYLRYKADNKPFDEETVKNLYIARAFVLDLLKDTCFAPSAPGHLHVVVDGDSPLMLSVLRQLTLTAHYLNYVEYDSLGRLSCSNRSVITLISQKAAEDICRELKKEEYLCNLPEFCKCNVYGDVKNEDSYIDVELEIVSTPPDGEGKLWIKEKDVLDYMSSLKAADDVVSIDTRKAVYADGAYCLGAIIDNLPYEDIHSAERYTRALYAFEYKLLQENAGSLVDIRKWPKSLTAVKNGLSNIFCSDLFESREQGIKQFARDNNISEKSAWNSCKEVLCCSEHNRWVVEKLIMGFRPFNAEERLCYDSLFGDSRKAYIKQLKTREQDPVHIDICSYRDLHQIDPDNLKYDGFLMLAIPLILGKIRKDDGR